MIVKTEKYKNNELVEESWHCECQFCGRKTREYRSKEDCIKTANGKGWTINEERNVCVVCTNSNSFYQMKQYGLMLTREAAENFKNYFRGEA